MTSFSPEILAPAGDADSFLAALAAGADAVYCGLKNFSARMQAENFSLQELSALTELAHAKNRRVYITMNTLLKPGELPQAGRLLDRLNRQVKPDALIFQDLALPELARQSGFSGELHLSTLGNAGSASGLQMIADQGIQRVVLPREVSIDEIKLLAGQCPEHLTLEVFVHGALCYAVSGRCYWSSYLGGKSGLRGRCVQPCRRMYRQRNTTLPFFSCDDLSLDVLVRPLRTVPQVGSWKIEGRKKGPHYVYHTVRAYQLLRDHGDDPAQRKTAQELLTMALGRPKTHYNFLGHRPSNPLGDREQTASGQHVAKIQGGGRAYITPRIPLQSGDLLRIGYEDQPGHQTLRIRRSVPKGGRLDIPRTGKRPPNQGLPVFLVDRRDPELTRILADLRQELGAGTKTRESSFEPVLPKAERVRGKGREMDVWRILPKRLGTKSEQGLWLTPGQERGVSKTIFKRIWWWLPPIVWPTDEERWQSCLKNMLRLGARKFVLGAPWQKGLFSSEERCELWASPMMNTANPLTLLHLKNLGFSGAFVSPELGSEDILSLPSLSPLPLGIVAKGLFPLCLGRTRSEKLREREGFTSPKGEIFWSRTYGQLVWTYPNWELDLSQFWGDLEKAGYAVLARLHEPAPEKVRMKERPGLWNWNVDIL